MRRCARMEQMMPEWGGNRVQWHIVEGIPFDVAVGIKQCKQVTMISYTYLPKLNEIGVRRRKRSSFIPWKLFLFGAPTLTDDRIWLSLQPIFGHGLHISWLWFAGGSRDLWDCKRNLFVAVSFHLHETHWLPHIPGICLYLQLSKSWFLPDWYSGSPTLPQTMKSIYKGWWLHPRFRKKMKSVMAQKLTHGDHISVGIIHSLVAHFRLISVQAFRLRCLSPSFSHCVMKSSNDGMAPDKMGVIWADIICWTSWGACKMWLEPGY